MENGKSALSFLTMKNIGRILGVILVVCFFVPSFAVSCSGYEVNMSTSDLTFGKSYQGQTVTEARPICILFLLLPVAIIVISFLKKQLDEHKTALIGMICAAVDLVLWIVAIIRVKNVAKENMCEASAKAGFVFSIIFLILLLAINIAIYLKKISEDTEITDLVNIIKRMAQPSNPQQTQIPQGTTDQSTTQNTAQSAVCASCGAPLRAGAKFCSKCGTKVEE